jgi:hypothetical protein
MHRPKLLDRRPMPLTTGDVPVATDVFLHNLERSTQEALRRAIEQGLTPSGLDFTGDDDSIVILRFTRPRAAEAHLMVGVEFYPEGNEVVGKVYDAKFELMYSSEPRDAHISGERPQIL